MIHNSIADAPIGLRFAPLESPWNFTSGYILFTWSNPQSKVNTWRNDRITQNSTVAVHHFITSKPLVRGIIQVVQWVDLIGAQFRLVERSNLTLCCHKWLYCKNMHFVKILCACKGYPNHGNQYLPGSNCQPQLMWCFCYLTLAWEVWDHVRWHM